ncbi:hypothetical protein BDW59DRAFT_157892 [Aspergillus cavernicola]|uniref:F-box domain-containing protein n=1 Tax=Aspergillus cavernicola TaxID=176166 RepID=A0ABR4IUP6_9EURO
MDTNQKSGLIKLPYELLRAVFDDLESDSLLRLCLTSKSLYRFTLPELHRSVVIRTAKTESFKRLCENDPAMADSVESLTIHYHYESLPAEGLSPVIACMSGLRNLTVREQIWRPTSGDVQRKLGLQWLFQQSMQSPNILGSLRSCELYLDDRWDLSARDAVFFHPQLRNLSIINAQMADFPTFDKSKERTTLLGNLTLVRCEFGPNVLNQVLAVPKALQKLTFRGPPTLLLQQPPPVPQVQQHPLLTAIAQQADSLTMLNLFFCHPLLAEWYLPLNFRPLRALEELAITTYDLGDDVEILPDQNPLPRSLKKLDIYNPLFFNGFDFSGLPIEKEFMEALGSWVSAGDLPNLALLILSVPSPVSAEVPGGFNDPLIPGTNVPVERRAWDELQRLHFNCWCRDNNPYST